MKPNTVNLNFQAIAFNKKQDKPKLYLLLTMNRLVISELEVSGDRFLKT